MTLFAMEDILDRSEHCAYSRTHMQSKLEEHFGDRIVVTHVNGSPMLSHSGIQLRLFSTNFTAVNENLIQAQKI